MKAHLARKRFPAIRMLVSLACLICILAAVFPLAACSENAPDIPVITTKPLEKESTPTETHMEEAAEEPEPTAELSQASDKETAPETIQDPSTKPAEPPSEPSIEPSTEPSIEPSTDAALYSVDIIKPSNLIAADFIKVPDKGERSGIVTGELTGENPDSYSIITVIQTEADLLCFVKPSMATPFSNVKDGKFNVRFYTDIAADFDVPWIYLYFVPSGYNAVLNAADGQQWAVSPASLDKVLEDCELAVLINR